MTCTAKEVFRTASKYIQDAFGGFGKGLEHGVNQVCICCKAGSTMDDGSVVGNVERIRDQVELKPWSDFYKTKDFAAYKCGSCGYKWSWYRDKT